MKLDEFVNKNIDEKNNEFSSFLGISNEDKKEETVKEKKKVKLNISRNPTKNIDTGPDIQKNEYNDLKDIFSYYGESNNSSGESLNNISDVSFTGKEDIDIGDNEANNDIQNNSEPEKQNIEKIVTPVLKEPPKETKKTAKQIKEEKAKEEEEKLAIKIEELFSKSETEEKYREKWETIYRKALSTPLNKRNYVIEKCIKGRFTIRDDKTEILPEMDVKGKSSKDLMNEPWKLS